MTVIGYVPGAVPEPPVGTTPVPPAHAGMNSTLMAITASVITRNIFFRCCFGVLVRKSPKRPNPGNGSNIPYTGPTRVGKKLSAAAENDEVVIVRLTLAGLEPGVTEGGENRHFELAGSPAQRNVIWLLKLVPTGEIDNA